jgi:hypothetical protein
MKVRILFLVFLSFCVSLSAISQIKFDSSKIEQKFLIGIWQLNTDVISSTLHKTVQFYKNNRFVYSMDTYNDLNPIVSISGRYKIEIRGISLLIEEIKHLTEYKIEEADHGFQFGLFQLAGGKIVVFKQNDGEYSFHELKKIKGVSKKEEVIMIDNEKYFKISNNPDKYKIK